MSSNGIFIDETPPEITDLYHIDLGYDPDEPTEYQGQNHTIAVMLDTVDKESEVCEQWTYIKCLNICTDFKRHNKNDMKMNNINTLYFGESGIALEVMPSVDMIH